MLYLELLIQSVVIFAISYHRSTFQVVNHGIENQVLQKMKDTARLFLDLPLEEKNKFSMPTDDMQGYGYAFVFSEEQKLDWNDALVLIMFPTRFRKYKFWPTTPEDFK